MANHTKQKNYNHTITACYLGYITQAIVNNFAPLLFVTFQNSFHISLDRLALLVSINFGVQLIVDSLAAKFVDRIGYRISVVAAHVFASVGLLGLAVFPMLIPNAFLALSLAGVLYAIGGGLIEVLISPIVEACPSERKEAAMSLLHSFYCWGQVAVVLLSTLFFVLVGVKHWQFLACLWALLPAANAIFFTQVPIAKLVEEGEGLSIRLLLRNKIFWVLCILMVCAGASELGMSQWASAFAEEGLKVSKTIGDLAGPCAFAVFMGTARALYAKFSDKISLVRFMAVCGFLCIISYLMASVLANPILGLAGCSLCGISVGIMWPGTFSIASRALPKGGTAMFALLALAGDLGGTTGPALVGVVSSALGDNLKQGIMAAGIFPVILVLGLFLYQHIQRKNDTKNIENR